MNAEALIGTALGSWTLQSVLRPGVGETVFLAREISSGRQATVKALDLAWLSPVQQAFFRERFRREAASIMSLKHPNIVPIYEHGEQESFVYLVSPFIDGPTLRDVLEQAAPVALPQVLNYLEQLAQALDFAHARGLVHLGLAPLKIFRVGDNHLLISDFGLVTIVADGKTLQQRIAQGSIAPGMLEYMAPEQLSAGTIDERADLYALGVILYHMVTGKVPFSADMLQRMTSERQRNLPLAPRTLRRGLSIATEQVLLRALAQQPGDRFSCGRELLSAFHAAVAVESGEQSLYSELKIPSARFPSQLPSTSDGQPASGVPEDHEATMSMSARGARKVRPARLSLATDVAVSPAPEMTPSSSMPAVEQTGALSTPTATLRAAQAIKLTAPVKVVQVPIAGQPGRYVTGLLPATTQLQPVEELPAAAGDTPLATTTRKQSWPKLLAIVVILLALLGSSALLLPRLAQQHQPRVGKHLPNYLATAQTAATATVQANTIVIDPLNQNIHNWPVAVTGSKMYNFIDGSFHIIDNDAKQSAPALLPDINITGPLVYTLTMEEIKGNDTSINNSFGMILRFSVQKRGSRSVTTFYSFEVVNAKGGAYQFWKYDDSVKAPGGPWTSIWHHSFGREFHQGHGPGSSNTFQVIANGKYFTFYVNGVKVGTTQNSALAGGQVGMLVNLKGTEVAFSNLLLTNS